MNRRLSEPALRGIVDPSLEDRRRRRWQAPWARDARHMPQALPEPDKGAAPSSGTCTPPSSASSLGSLSDRGGASRRQPRSSSQSAADVAPSCSQLTLSMAALRLKDLQVGLVTSKRCSSSGIARRSSLSHAGGLSFGSPVRNPQRAKMAQEFHDFDADDDGHLNKREFMAWLRCELRWGSPMSSADPLSAHRRADFMQHQFEKADQDGNERISPDEFAHYREKFQSALQAVQFSGFSEGFRARSVGCET